MINLFLHAALLTTTPILLAAIGGFVNRMGGLVNLGLESMMLAGALVGVEVSAATGSALLATLAAAAVGAIVALLMSLVITRLRANEIIVGLGFTVAVAGLVRFILKSAYGASGTYNPPGVAMLPRLDISPLESVPVLGALSGLDPLTWLAWALVPAVAFAIARTRWGLRLRATGAAEATVRSVGLQPLAIRDGSTVFAGALSGLAGAHLSIGDRRSLQRGHHRRARLHRARRLLFRPDVRLPGRLSARSCSASSTRRKSGCRDEACRRRSSRRCPTSSSLSS